MQLQGTVISYTASTKIQKQGGGSYDAWELVYRSSENEVKQLAKPVQSLRFNPLLKAALASLVPNDEFTADLEKNAAGFWDVKEVVKGIVNNKPAAAEAGNDRPAVAERPIAPQRAANRVVGSTYETPEERAKKQVIIVRQSSVAQAVASTATDTPLDVILERASEIEKHVNKGLKAAAKRYLDVKLNEEEAEAK